MADDVQEVKGPDGKTYHFPKGTTKEAAIGYFKKKGIGKAAAPVAPAAPSAKPVEQEGLATKVGRGAALGVFEGLGVNPSTNRKEVITGTLGQIGSSIKNTYMKDYREAAASPVFKGDPIGAGAMAAISFPARMLEGAASSIHHGFDETKQAIENKDWEGASEHAASTLTQILAAKEMEKGKEVLSKESLESISKNATQRTIQKLVHDRAQGIKRHLAYVEENVKAEDSARWQHIEKTVDAQNPNGAIDLDKIGAESRKTSQEMVLAGQKQPPTVGQVEQMSDVPRVAGMRLDPKNAQHMEMLNNLRAQGVITEGDKASFAKVRQLRSKLGHELSTGRYPDVVGVGGWKLYDNLTHAMRDVSLKAGLGGSFDDANAFHAKYMEHWGPDTALGKAIEGKNASDVLSELSSPKRAEELRKVMEQYRGHGMSPETVAKEGKIFQKLGSGLPQQLPFSRWEALTYALKPAAGPLYTGSREAFNWFKRDQALQEVRDPNVSPPTAVTPWKPPSPEVLARQNADILRKVQAKLGNRASVKEIMAEADRSRNSPSP